MLGAAAERFDGTKWEPLSMFDSTSLVGSTPAPLLHAVSCATGSCTAVGVEFTFTSPTYFTPYKLVAQSSAPGGAFTMTDQFNTGSVGLSHGHLRGVSCVSASWCMAVGEVSSINSESPTPDVMTWDGTQWSQGVVPNPGSAGTLDSVSCVSQTQCVAVGTTLGAPFGTPLAATWNGTNWSAMTLPSGSGELVSVSCPTSTMCLAVGIDASAFAIADAWDGTAWTTVTVPRPRISIVTRLNSVSCATATDCLAVGRVARATPRQFALSEHYDGAALMIVRSP
jgi:hypothetical protein